MIGTATSATARLASMSASTCSGSNRARSTTVEFSAGDHESVWDSTPAALADVAALFTASPRVVVNEAADSGHNLSVGLTAAAYHRHVLSFVEECAVAGEGTGVETEAG